MTDRKLSGWREEKRLHKGLVDGCVFASVMVNAVSKKHNEDRKIVARSATLGGDRRVNASLPNLS
jgi:hypothetical protein